jgi:hypothetical protein
MRGLEEKIWKVFAPRSWAFSAAFSSDPEIDVWMPIRKTECSSYQMGLIR